ncbi:MAG TPA: hypothetical protein VFG89_08980 [Coriobacteriia bacterium]|nr:hypothetical protein [Coriobacteriia bacterium]
MSSATVLSRRFVWALVCLLLCVVVALMFGGVPETARAQIPEWSAHVVDSEGARTIYFVDANEGWAGDLDGYLFHTTDGGVTWAKSRLPQSKTSSFRFGTARQIQFIDKTNGWVLSAGDYKAKDGYWYNASRLYRTTDGGATWTKLWTRRASVAEFQFVSPTRGWFVLGRTVYRSTNGGVTLKNQHADKAILAPKKLAWLQGLRFVDANNGWACGGYIGGWTKPILLRTRNGGKTWKRAKFGLVGGVNDVWFVNRSVGYAIAKGLYKTTNAGKSWHRIKYAKSQGYDLIQGFGTTGVRLVGGKPRVTDGPSNVTTVVWTSRDGGATWTSVDLDTAYTGGTVADASAMWFIDIDTGWIAGGRRDTPESGSQYCILRTPGIEEAVVAPPLE